jgi:uncharacterized protein (DUF2062 family)
MLFRRRKKATQWERFKVWLWPRVSWRRSVLYFVKRTLRLSGSPHAIALGCAVGAFAAFTPFLGLHIVIAVVIAWLLRGNLIAGAVGTFIGNPLSFPFIWAGTYEVASSSCEAGAPARRNCSPRHPRACHSNSSFRLFSRCSSDRFPLVSPPAASSTSWSKGP